jgi:hypothetical protein
LTLHALQDAFFMQPAVFVGLLAHLTGLTLQDDIATTARRLQQLRRDILGGSTHHPGGSPVALSDSYAPEAVARALNDAFTYEAFSSEYIANLLEQRACFTSEASALHLTRRVPLMITGERAPLVAWCRRLLGTGLSYPPAERHRPAPRCRAVRGASGW